MIIVERKLDTEFGLQIRVHKKYPAYGGGIFLYRLNDSIPLSVK